MNILLLSMPDSFEHMPTVAVRMPNGALATLAANVDRGHRVSVADLILAQRTVRETVRDLLHRYQPALVGLSVMTFQRETARAIARLVRREMPDAHIVAGGYDPSLAVDEYTANDGLFDSIVRGEGELTFRALVRALARGDPLGSIAGLTWRDGGTVVHNPDRPPAQLDDDFFPGVRCVRHLVVCLVEQEVRCLQSLVVTCHAVCRDELSRGTRQCRPGLGL